MGGTESVHRNMTFFVRWTPLDIDKLLRVDILKEDGG